MTEDERLARRIELGRQLQAAYDRLSEGMGVLGSPYFEDESMLVDAERFETIQATLREIDDLVEELKQLD